LRKTTATREPRARGHFLAALSCDLNGGDISIDVVREKRSDEALIFVHGFNTSASPVSHCANRMGISLAIAARKLPDERYDAQARRGSRYSHERLGEPKPVLTRNEIVDIGRR
jgi:hypothetical protein